MATTDPNPPVTSGAESAEFGETANTPGSLDTELVTGHSGATSKLAPTTSELGGAIVETDTWDAGYNLGSQEVASNGTLAPNTNDGRKVDNYDGTTNGASASNTIVPGDTEAAYGHSGNLADSYIGPATGSTEVAFGSQDHTQATSPAPELNTLGWKGGAGVLPANYGSTAVTAGPVAAFYGQHTTDPGDLDTTNTAIPTTSTTPNNGTSTPPTSYNVSPVDTQYGYPNLTPGYSGGVLLPAPHAPTGVSWTYSQDSAIVSWTAPDNASAAKVREYIISGYRVKDDTYIPTDDTTANAFTEPTVTWHSQHHSGTGAPSDLSAEVPHLEPGAHYFFRVLARNDNGNGPRSTVVGVTPPASPNNTPTLPMASGLNEGTVLSTEASYDNL